MTTHDGFDHEPMPEGEEAAPPLTRTMGYVRWIILGIMSLFALVMVLTALGLTPWAQTTSGGTQYHCPMHPTYVSSQPGDCPICGMSLVPIDGSSSDSTSHHREHATADSLPKPQPGQYYCPMDPEVVSDTAGRCPICNMFLEEVPPDSANSPAYVCPMHPDETSDHPGSCSQCGMDLVPASSGSEASGHTAGHSTVPGLVPVTIEANRLQLIGVRTERAAMRSLDQTVRAVGYITPDESRLYRVQARFSGWITKVFANETGREIRQGDPLFAVYSPELMQAISDYRRSGGLSGAGTLSSLSSQALREAARERLVFLGFAHNEIAQLVSGDSAPEEVVMRSPHDGVITERQITPGQNIQPGQTLMTLVDLSRIWVMAEIYESDLNKVMAGQDATLTVDAYPGDQFQGRLSFVSPLISEQSRTVGVRLEFVNMQTRLKPGMYGSVAITTSSEQALAIPSSALLDGGEMQYVFVTKDNNRFEPRKVVVGGHNDNYVAILEGLTVGDRVVTSANFLIDSESRLQAAITGSGGAPTGHEGH